MISYFGSHTYLWKLGSWLTNENIKLGPKREFELVNCPETGKQMSYACQAESGDDVAVVDVDLDGVDHPC